MKSGGMIRRIFLTGKSSARIASTSSHRHKKQSTKASILNQLSFRWWTQPSTFSIQRPSLIWSASPFSLFLWIHPSLLWRKRKNGTIHYVLFACATPASCHRPASFYLNQKYRKRYYDLFHIPTPTSIEEIWRHSSWGPCSSSNRRPCSLIAHWSISTKTIKKLKASSSKRRTYQ